MHKRSIDLIFSRGQSALNVMHLFLWLGLAFLGPVSTAGAQKIASWQTGLEGFVDGLITTGLDQEAVAGAIVVIVAGDDVIFEKGYRLADARTGRPMTPGDVVPLASVTKVFTALAVLQLARDGRLALDDPIAEHLPDLKLDQPYGDIRIRHLLAHAAGLEDRYRGYFADHVNRADATLLSQISAVLPRQIRPPADTISYSNASFVLLGAIVAHVSGQSYEEFVAKAVLARMGVASAHFMHEHLDAAIVSPFHIWQDGSYEAIDPEPFVSIHTSSGGLALSGRDMGMVMRFLLRTGSVDECATSIAKAVADMKNPAFPDRKEFAGRSLGYWTETWAGHQVYHHGGSHFGFHSNMMLVPELDLGIFVSANSPAGSSLMALPRRLLRAAVAPNERYAAERTGCDETCLQAYEGGYISTRRNETGLDRILVPYVTTFTATAKGDNALLVTGLGPSRRFEAIAEDEFETPEGDTRLGFRRNGDGRIVGAFLNGGIHSFDRLDFWQTSASLDSALWAAIAGSLLCLAGAVIGWRRRRRILSMSLCQGILWIGLIIGIAEILEQVTHGDDLSEAATPGAGLWTMTFLCAAGFVSLLPVTIRVFFTTNTERNPNSERLAMLCALPFFAWSLFAAWKWNLPTAALAW